MPFSEKSGSPEAVTVSPDGQAGEHEEHKINASGHVQELERNFSILSIIGYGLVCGNVWPALGGSILVALYNGGPPGISTYVG